MGIHEKVDRCANENQKRKSTVVEMAPSATDNNEDWLKAKDLIDSNIEILTNSDEKTEERCNLLLSVRNSINVISNSIKTVSSISPPLHNFIETLTQLLKSGNIDIKIRFSIADILCTLSEKDLFVLTSANFILLICFLIENCPIHMDEKNMVSHVRKLRKLLTNMHNDEDLKSECVLAKHTIMSSSQVLLKHIRFCVTENGKEIVSLIVALHEIIVKEFHTRVKRLLMSCCKSEAFAFGKMYFRIWELTSDDVRKLLEEQCIQWLMERAFTLGRRENTVKCLSINLQGLLSGLHCCRKLAKFSKVITTLYSPLIWKYLNCENSVHRTNAAEIFMNVYPLERPGEGKTIYSQFLRKQHEEMLSLLNDPCPLVRVIAIKGICSNMKYFWVTFQNGTAEQVVKKLISDMVVDGTSFFVRKAVYQGFTQLLENADSHKLLKGVLPSLSKFLHDENQSVRQSFLKMLLKIKNIPCEIKYYHIVDIDNIAARLENDSPMNQRLIVKLIFSSFFGSKIRIEETYKRICRFVYVNPKASRNLAVHSKGVLTLKEATDLMCMILLRIYMDIKKKMEPSGGENKESEKSDKPESSRKQNTVLSSIENISESDRPGTEETDVSASTTSSEGGRKLTSVCNPTIAHGLFDFVSVLWLIHGKQLLEIENKEHLDKLYTCSVKCIPPALRYFKGSHAFFGVLYMAGMIPLIKIQHQTTVVGSCLSMLRQVSDESQISEYHCIVHVLCIWNRGADVLELTREWLDEAFRSQRLNESFCKREFMRSKRVKFVSDEAKPTLALGILEELFNSPSDQQCIFSKNNADLLDLLEYLAKIKILIEKRIEKGSELNKLLNDAFLRKGLTLYGNLIMMFLQNEVANFNFWKKIAEYIEWSDKTLGQGSATVDIDNVQLQNFIGEMLQIPLMQCYHLIAFGKCTDEQIVLLSAFYLSALNSDSGMYCIDVTVAFAKQVLLLSKVLHKNKRNNDVMTVWFPKLLDTILSLLTDKIYTKDVLSRYIKDLASLRKDLMFIYMVITKLYPKLYHTNLSYQVLHSFCNHLTNIVLFPIRECETLNVDQSIKNLPLVGSVLAAVFISQVELASAFLFVLKKIIDNYGDADALHLLATASLLYTLAFTQGKIKKSEILKVVQVTYGKLQSITAEEGCLALVMNHEQTVGDRTIIDIEETTELAVKEIGMHILKMIAEHLGGSLS